MCLYARMEETAKIKISITIYMSIRQFRTIVKEVERYLGHNDTTDADELYKAGKHYLGKKFRGVYPRDKLPKLKDGQSMIINLDTSKQSGSHWIAIYCSGNSYVVYDSFGRKIIGGILPRMTFSGCGKKIITSPDYDAEQKTYETDCGQNSLGWLIFVYEYGITKGLKI